MTAHCHFFTVRIRHPFPLAAGIMGRLGLQWSCVIITDDGCVFEGEVWTPADAQDAKVIQVARRHRPVWADPRRRKIFFQ